MKIILQILILLLAACNPSAKENSNAETPLDSISSTESKANDDKMVYVTRDGNKYHTTDCRYAEGGKIVSLSRARAAGRKACDVCKPNSDKDQKRCTALTADKTQCKRMTTDASGKCFQHNK